MIRQFNCHEVQGYYFSHPQLPVDFERMYLNKENVEFTNINETNKGKRKKVEFNFNSSASKFAS